MLRGLCALPAVAPVPELLLHHGQVHGRDLAPGGAARQGRAARHRGRRQDCSSSSRTMADRDSCRPSATPTPADTTARAGSAAWGWAGAPTACTVSRGAPTIAFELRKMPPASIIETGRVRTHAVAMLRTVRAWMPDWFATIVPAMPELSTRYSSVPRVVRADSGRRGA